MEKSKSELKLQYELKSEEALIHHLEVLTLALDLPADKFEEFYRQEREAYNTLQEGLLSQFEQDMEGAEWQ